MCLRRARNILLLLLKNIHYRLSFTSEGVEAVTSKRPNSMLFGRFLLPTGSFLCVIS